MAFCDNCGHVLRSTAKFCGSCGETVNANSDNRINNTSGIQQKTGIQTYQILSIIGGVMGLVVSLLYAALTSLLDSLSTSFGAEGFSSGFQEWFVIAMPLAIIIYISCFVVPFVIKKTKIVGIYLIVCSFIVLIATSYVGLAGFALMLPAGILALRHKS